jgi:WD40 repeat protein
MGALKRWMLAGLALSAVAAAPPAEFVRPYAVLTGHSEGVGCVAFSPDGRWLASGSRRHDRAKGTYHGEFRIWDVKARKLRNAWSGHKDRPTALAFAPDGKALVSITLELELARWNADTGKAEWTRQSDRACSPAMRLFFAADGKQVGACSPTAALVWDAVSGKQQFRHDRKINGWCSILGHDLRLVAAPNHQDVDLWDVRSGKLVRSLLDHRGMVEALAFSRDDRLLAVACSRRTDEDDYSSEIWLWDVKRGVRKRIIPLGNLYSHCLVLSPRGDLLVVAGRLDVHGAAQLRLFAISNGRELARLRPPVKAILSPVFSPDEKFLAAGCDDRTVRLWSVARTGTR